MEGYIEIEKYELLDAQYRALAERVEALNFQLDQFKRMLFGAKSERFIADVYPEQLSLFAPPAEEKVVEDEKVIVPAHERKPVKVKKHPVRLVLPPHLKREETILEPEGLDLSQMVRIGEERTETLMYTPAELIVKVIVRPKYAPKSPEAHHLVDESAGAIQIAALPSRFIDKCVADESLVGVILTDKYLDHLPLYRIAARFERLGMIIPPSTLCGWVSQSAARIEVMYNKIKDLVLKAAYLQVDETRMEVLPEKGKRPPPGKAGKKRKTHRGYLWGYHAVLDKLVFFDYSPTRQADNPIANLKHFNGKLQTDCYSIYDQIAQVYPDLEHLHCLGHSRREFEKALGNDAKRAGYALEQFQKLYAVERKAVELGLDAQATQQMRDQQARPVLDSLFVWMEQASPSLPPSSPIAHAMNYMLKRKDAMTHYLSDGRLMIDNNPMENLIRPIAVGRRNYLFAGSHQGAQHGAIFYTLFACCKLNGVDPTRWLKDVMNRLPNHPVNRIEELLPHRWKAPSQDAPDDMQGV